MSSGGAPAGEAWRVVLCTDASGMVVPLIQGALEAEGHRLVGVVTGPGPRKRRSDVYLDVVRAVPPGVDVLVTTHMGRLAAMLAPLQPDLLVVCGFLWRLPPAVLRLPRRGALNVHLGLLPGQRGPNPYGWAFRRDEPEVGVTVHYLAEEFDTGAVLAESRLPVGDEDDMAALLPRLLGTVPDLLARALVRVATGDPGDPQDEARAFYAGLFTDDWREIDWSRPARAVHNQVRSWVGLRGVAHGAFGVIDGEWVLITKTRLVEGEAPALAPGAALRREDGTLLVGCGDRPLAILAWEPAEAASPSPAPEPAQHREG